MWSKLTLAAGVACLLFAAPSVDACSPPPNWEGPAGVNKQAEKASIVVKARVINRLGDNPFEEKAQVRALKYFKGCGPAKFTIEGFRGSSMCSVDAPKEGQTRFFFLRQNADGDYNLISGINEGVASVDRKNVLQLREVLDKSKFRKPNQCKATCTYE